MWKKKVKIFIGILLLLVGVLFLTGVVFLFGTRMYVRKQIQEAMTEEIESRDKDAVSDKQYTYWLEMENVDIKAYIYVPGHNRDHQLVPLTVLSLNEHYESEGEIGYGEYDKIVEYCKAHEEMQTEDTYRQLQIDNHEYCVMARQYEVEGKTMVTLYIATPDKLLELIGKINFIFLLVMLVLGIVLFFVSYKVGVGFERDKEKLTRYFQNASHELKTPIMSIQGYAEGIRTGVIKDTDNATEVILSESDRMNELVGEILFLSKMDTGYADKTKEKVDMTDLVCDCTNNILRNAKERGVEINIAVSKEHFCVMGNEMQLERAVGNILSNAVRFAKKTIAVSMKKEGKWICIDIYNDGEEIPVKDIPYIFDRFYKGENGGHGIGLSIAKEVIKAHRGKIKVCNENGVKFSVWLKRI